MTVPYLACCLLPLMREGGFGGDALRVVGSRRQDGHERLGCGSGGPRAGASGGRDEGPDQLLS